MTAPGGGPVAVVGASLAGVHAARALRELGFTGRLAVFGAEPRAPYDRPPLSKQILQGTWTPEQAALRPGPGDASIEWHLGTRAAGLDAATLTLQLPGRAETFPGGIVIATGAVARTLPGAARPGVHLLRTMDDALALAADLRAGPEHVVVAGGGFIGGEVAASARSLGLAVTVVEMTDVPFTRGVGDEVGAQIARLHRSHGTQVIAGERVAAVQGEPRVTGVELASGRRLPADVIVLGLGVIPDTAWLDGSGLTVDDGVRCDETLLAAPRIVVAGDAARWPDGEGGTQRLEHWDNAIQQGRHAAARLLAAHGNEPAQPFTVVPWMWSDQYGTKIQLHGTARGHDEVAFTHGQPGEDRFVALFGRAGVLVGAAGFGRAKASASYRKAIAARTPLAEVLAAHRDQIQGAA